MEYHVDRVYSFGYNRYGQGGADVKDVNLYSPHLVLIDEDEIPVKIACGYQHGVCLCESGRAYAWGKADHGQLGRGDVDMTFKPLMVRDDDHLSCRWIQILPFIIKIFMLDLVQQ